MSAAVDVWATKPGPARVLAAARARLEQGHAGDRVRLDVSLDATERADVGRLLGVAWQVSPAPVTLGQLRAALTTAGDDLTAVLTRQGGPLRDLRAERAARDADRQATVTAAHELLAGAEMPDHVVSLARARRWLGRPGTDDLTARADALARLWQVLPAPGRLLPELASSLYQDPHALDRDADLGRVAARILAAAAATSEAAAAAADEALNAAAWRRTWAAFGVVCDAVSSTVLVLRLPLTGEAAAAHLAQVAAGLGEPVWLTARSLRGAWAPDPCVTTVRVCENPSVVEAAADALGVACPPVVCVYGRPSGAAWTLLRGLSSAGVRLLVSADRDAAGRRFSDEMLSLPGAQPWLPDADGTYEEDRLADLLADLRAADGFEHAGPDHRD